MILSENTQLQVRQSGSNFYVEYKGTEGWCIFRTDTAKKAMNFFNRATKDGNIK